MPGNEHHYWGFTSSSLWVYNEDQKRVPFPESFNVLDEGKDGYIQNCSLHVTLKGIRDIMYHIHMEIQRTQNRQFNLEKKNKVGGFTLTNFKTYYMANKKDSVIQAKDRHINLWNRIESPEIRFYTLAKVPRQLTGGKNSLFNKLCWDNWISR